LNIHRKLEKYGYLLYCLRGVENTKPKLPIKPWERADPTGKTMHDQLSGTVENAGTLTASPGDNRAANGYKSFIHQDEAQKALNRQIFKTPKSSFSGILAIPTGGGKTFIAVEWLLKHWMSQEKRVLWIAHRHELLNQAFHTFKKNTYVSLLQNKRTIRYRIVSGLHDKPINIKPSDDIIVASKDSLVRSINYLINNWLEPNHIEELFFVIDEAHHATAKTYRKLIRELQNRVPRLKILGLTATPFRTQEREHGYLYKVFPDDIVFKVDLRTLIARKILSEPVFEEATTNIPMTRTLSDGEIRKIQHFDLPEDIKEKIATQTDRNRIIVKRYAENQEKYGQLLVYALNIHHAFVLQDFFKDQGIKAEYVVSNIQDAAHRINLSKENPVKIEKFRRGEIQVLINVNILTEGADLPNVQSVFLTRPTISRILMTQMIGRALRGTDAGGTAKAYIVSFVDDWQEKISWVNPEKLFILENTDFDDSDQETKKRIIQLISIEKIQEFARLADRTIDTSGIQKLDFLDRIPVGIYAFSRLVSNHDGEEYEKNCEVLVYDHLQHPYSQFVNDLDALFKEAGIDVDNQETLQEIELDKLCATVRSRYFYDEQFVLGYNDEDIKDILLYYFDKQLTPKFIPFEDRSKYDIDKIAEEIDEKDLGPKNKTRFLNNLWEKEHDIWQTLFGYNKAYFLAEVDLSLNRRLHGAEIFEETNHQAPVDLKESRNLEDLSLSEIRKIDPKVESELREAVFRKHTNEKGEYVCALSGYVSASRLTFEIDHIIPLSKGGKTRLDNLQLLAWWENRRKSDNIVSDGPQTTEFEELNPKNSPQIDYSPIDNKDIKRVEIEQRIFSDEITKSELSDIFQSYHKTAEDNDPESQFMVGKMYEYGRGAPQDSQKAMEWYERSAELGCLDALNALGLIYVDGRKQIQADQKKAFRNFKKGAAQNHPYCQANLGLAYDAGIGTKRNFKEAAKWYRKAADQGVAFAQNSLGFMYQQGEGVPQDYTEAAKWHEMAAEQGLPEAQNFLGVLYDSGKGVPQDEAKAVELYRMAAEGGDVNAKANLGVKYYYGGKEVVRNYAEAANWYRQAAEDGDIKSQKSLARMYAKGKGIQKNLELAYAWFSVAYEGVNREIKEFENVKKTLSTSQRRNAEKLAEELRKKMS
jgi:TPR repeat protein/superfamily II DNA or RNA helicase